MPTAEERRAYPRVPVDSDAVVYLGGEQISCKVRDIARGGIGLTCAVQRNAGSRLQVHFQLPGGDWMRTDAILVRNARFYGFYVWGLAFKPLDGWSSAQLESFLGKHLN